MVDTFSDKPWDGSASNWPDAQSYCDSCLINTNTGARSDWTKGACKLPYKFPNGSVSSVSVHNCAAVLAGARGGLVGVSPADKKAAAKKLLTLYSEMKEPPPDNLKRMAQ